MAIETSLTEGYAVKAKYKLKVCVLKTLRCTGSPIPHLGAVLICWRWSLQALSPLCCLFRLKSFQLASGSHSLPWSLGLSSGYPQSSIPYCSMFLFNFLTICTSLLSLPVAVPVPPFFSSPPFSLTGPYLPIPPVITLFLLLYRIEASTLWSFFLSCL